MHRKGVGIALPGRPFTLPHLGRPPHLVGGIIRRGGPQKKTYIALGCRRRQPGHSRVTYVNAGTLGAYTSCRGRPSARHSRRRRLTGGGTGARTLT